MGEGTHRQVEYSFIMVNPLKQGYELEGRGKSWRLEQKLGERHMREKWEHSLGNREVLLKLQNGSSAIWKPSQLGWI